MSKEGKKSEMKVEKEALLKTKVKDYRETNKIVPILKSGEKKEKKMKLAFKKKSSTLQFDDTCKGKKAPDGVQLEVEGREARDEERPEFFGVRSYLHNFYESVSVKNPQMYEDIYEDELLYVDQVKKRRRVALCWKLSLFFGSTALFVGLIFLFVGYLTPRREVVVGYQEDMEIIDRDAVGFNYNIKLCRIIGLVVFCSGGCVFCTALLLSIINNMQFDDPDYQDPLEPFCVSVVDDDPPQSPTDKMVPATEELTSVQPKREVEVVMTNAGLCKPPCLKSSSE